MITATMNVHQVIRSLAAAIGLLSILALGGLAHGGDVYGSFDESGHYNYHNSGSSLHPSIGQPGYEHDRRASELQASEAEQWRQEALRRESERQAAAAAPARPHSYQEQYWVQGRDGRSTLCVPQYNKSIVSCY